MKSGLKIIALVLMAASPIAGCSTSATSTHNNTIDHGGALTAHYETERGYRRVPRSDHVSRKSGQAEKFVVAGQDHFRDQNFGLAEKQFRKAVEAQSDNATAWLGLAASLDQLGRFEFSDRAYKQLAELKQGNARVLNNIGYSHLLRGNYQKSRNYLNRAQVIDPSLEEIEGNIHLLEKVMGS